MIYAGASGVGTAAIQLANWFEAKAFFTCSSQEKIDFCLKFLTYFKAEKREFFVIRLGAKQGFNYKKMKNDEILDNYMKIEKGKLMDVILDCVGPQNAELVYGFSFKN